MSTPETSPAPAASREESSQRLLSLDAYRGLVMFFLAASGFGIAKAAKLPGGEWLGGLAFHVEHPEWLSQFKLVGFSLWDMIQPSFMFIVGVSMPYSYAKREALGDSFARRARHAWTRALVLTLLGVFLQSLRAPETNWIFTNVLSQIGLGYGLLFFLVGKSFRLQALVGGAVLALYWLVFVVYPAPEPGLAAHFAKDTNAAAAFDRWFLNLFPRSKPFENNAGGYCTLNFVPSFVTMLMGVMGGQVLKNEALSGFEKVRRLAIGGAACLAAGVVFGLTLCPVVKRIWTPSWTLFAGAYTIWLLALMYWAIDLRGWKRWTFPFVVVGLNPITMYFMGQTMRGWTSSMLHTHLPGALFAGAKGPIVEALLVVAFFWWICWWMWRNRVFVRI
ncbi:MAG: hypothetical protein H7A53_13110 [Akkermansiaceae bacterium]|nr:hypothetical protein [Akkermansiaceae bacterium]